jgi:16S rRNA (cytidine1402-2'-O)-methyltransferase
MSGTLYLVATPIGNMEDMTYRAVRILSEVDVIACEDTRTSRKLLDHFDIHTPTTSYHEFNKIEKAPSLLRALDEGKDVALISDAGSPGISDPGEELVAMCYEEGYNVSAIPGATASVVALTSSGQKTRRFAFEAFLPKDKKERRRVLEEMERETRTLIVYEAPHRLKETLRELNQALGNRSITICRELTKKFEEHRKTTIEEAMTYYEQNDPRGEYVLIIAGKTKEEVAAEETARWEELSIEEHLQKYLDEGLEKKDAMKAVAKDRGVSKRDIYNALL